MRALGFRPEYGIIGAGALNTSLIARLPGIARSLGPVAAVSFRVASRMVNSLGAGFPARSVDELSGLRVILFHSSPDQFSPLAECLTSARIKWKGKSLVFCDCDCPEETRTVFHERGANVATIRRCQLPSRLIVEGSGAALAFAHRMAKDLGLKTLEIAPRDTEVFEMALTLGSGALTPLLDQTAALLRHCGVRDTEASKLAAALFEQTARDYSRTGRQSWIWYQRAPDHERLVAQLSAVSPRLRKRAGELILLGLEETGRHDESAEAIRTVIGESAERNNPGEESEPGLPKSGA